MPKAIPASQVLEEDIPMALMISFVGGSSADF